MLSSTITAPICVRSAFFIRRRQSLRLLFVVLQVARVFYYLSAAALQYLAPTILLLFSVLMLRGLGGYSVHTLNQQTFWFGLSCGQYTLIFMYQQQTMQDAVGIFYPYLFSSKQGGNHIWRAKSIYFTRFTSLRVALCAMDRVYPTAVLKVVGSTAVGDFEWWGGEWGGGGRGGVVVINLARWIVANTKEENGRRVCT